MLRLVATSMLSVVLVGAAGAEVRDEISQGDQPEIFVKMGHAGIQRSAVSDDGKVLVTQTQVNTKIWDVEARQEVRTFKLGIEDGGMAITSDGKAIFAAKRLRTSPCCNAEVSLWDIKRGQQIWNKAEKMDVSRDVSVSKNGRYGLVKGLGKFVLWDLAGAVRLMEFESYAAAFSPDSRYLLSARGDEKRLLDLRDTETGNTVAHFEGHSVGFDGSVTHISYSNDGRYAVSGVNKKEIIIWDMKGGRLLHRIPIEGKEEIIALAFTALNDAVVSVMYTGNWSVGGVTRIARLWDIQTGQLRWTLEHANFMSPDGQFIAADGDYLSIWNVTTRKKIGDIKENGFLNFLPDGRLLSLQNLTLHDPARREIDRTLEAKVEAQGCFRQEKDAAVLSTEHATWDLITGRLISVGGLSAKGITCADGHGLFVKFSMEEWCSRMRCDQNPNKRVSYTSADARYGLSTGKENVTLVDLTSGAVVGVIPGDSSGVKRIVFSHGGRHVAACLLEGSTTTRIVWDFSTARKIPLDTYGRMLWDCNRQTTTTFSSDDALLLTHASSLLDFDVLVWDLSTGKILRKYSGHETTVSSIYISPDSGEAISSDANGVIHRWEIATGRQLSTFAGHTPKIHMLDVLAGRQMVVSSSWDGAIRLYSQSGNEVVRFIALKDGDWLAITPEGYYNSSAKGDAYLNVRVGNKVYGIDQYRETFYKPQVVEAALRLGDSRKAIAEVLSTDQRPTISTLQSIEAPEVSILSPENGTKLPANAAALRVRVEDRHQPIKWIKVYINGRSVAATEARDITVTSSAKAVSTAGTGGLVIPDGRRIHDVTVKVELEPGENVIKVVAFNGYAESAALTRLHAPMRGLEPELLPNLWVLGIGINAYQDKAIRGLSYAVSDARDFVTALSRQKGRLFRNVHSLLITDKETLTPTYDTIVDNLAWLTKAGHRDIVILFIAGHGVNDERGDFYFLPSDAVLDSQGAVKRSKAVSWRELKAVLDLPAKKLIFADTCHSEGASGKRTRAVDNDRFVKELQEFNAVIFTSSRGQELSQESDQWKHGAFTWALLEGLGGKADLIKDGKVSMKELDAYVSETVPKLTNGAQHPITITPEGYVNFPIALVQ